MCISSMLITLQKRLFLFPFLGISCTVSQHTHTHSHFLLSVRRFLTCDWMMCECFGMHLFLWREKKNPQKTIESTKIEYASTFRCSRRFFRSRNNDFYYLFIRLDLDLCSFHIRCSESHPNSSLYFILAANRYGQLSTAQTPNIHNNKI